MPVERGSLRLVTAKSDWRGASPLVMKQEAPAGGEFTSM